MKVNFWRLCRFLKLHYRWFPYLQISLMVTIFFTSSKGVHKPHTHSTQVTVSLWLQFLVRYSRLTTEDKYFLPLQNHIRVQNLYRYKFPTSSKAADKPHKFHTSHLPSLGGYSVLGSIFSFFIRACISWLCKTTSEHKTINETSLAKNFTLSITLYIYLCFSEQWLVGYLSYSLSLSLWCPWPAYLPVNL